MTDIILMAIAGMLLLCLGKIYNRIDDIAKSLTSRKNHEIEEILDCLNKIEESVETIKCNM